MSSLTENPFASTNSLDTNPFDDPTPTHSTFPTNVPAGTANRVEELERRERELAAREQEINRKQEHLRKHGRNNWPFFFPLIFHSIKDEIPEGSQALVLRLYQLWLVLLGTLILNLVSCIFILLAGSDDGGRDLGASITYLPFIGILSFLLWYRPIYNAYMKEQALYYYIYFVFCGFHLLFSAYMLIGIPSTGSAGLINTISMYNRGALVAGILCTVTTVGWALQGLGQAFYYRSIWSHHNQQGHSFSKAKGELAEHGAKAYFTRG
ncbi:scamp-domain-containing protein [Exidia glandulosa HHB12029]|uniref:Scamp-domain-containing protein n=1 Tax=Exidia glandulosa HHB12029 TaxID=1314781 RepID=A0A165GEM9_EXIGL|nr:scamp-domain-containing protein [Exidia glandulosa HHB12029]